MIVAWSLLLSCGPANNANPDASPTDTSPPAPCFDLAIEVTQPNASAPLSRHLHAVTSTAASLTARWEADGHVVEVTWPESATVHEHTLIGFHPGKTHTLTVTATAAGMSCDATADVATEPWPADFPQAIVVALPGGQPAPGHTLIPINTSHSTASVSSAVFAVDEEGQPCFLLNIDDQLEDAVPYGAGLLVTSGLEQRVARFFRWDGTEDYAFTLDPEAVSPQVAVAAAVAERFHHDVLPIPDQADRFIALARYPTDIADWPASYSDPSLRENRTVSDDVILDFNRDGTVNAETLLSEFVPMDRIGYDSLENVFPGWGDWSHANSVWWDAGNYILSLRHQDAIVSLDPAAHELKWILGNSDNWIPPWSGKLLTPEAGLRWQWHQHAAELGPDAPDGRRQLITFDNANWQASPFTDVEPLMAPMSRVVQFGIDEVAMTVRMDWSYEVSTVTGTRLFSEAIGDADFLSNGNILSTWGMLDHQPDGSTNLSAGLGNRTIRIIEFDPTTLEDVWHLYLTVPAEDNDDGWTAYRSERIPSLYGRAVD